MIFYGTRSKTLASANLKEKCPSCQSENTVDMHVFQKYAHVFFIPVFPMGKTGATECSHCKQVLEKKDFTPELNEAYERLKTESSTPKWMYSGLVLIVLLVVFGIFQNGKNNEKNLALLAAPAAGDVYEVKPEENRYMLYKVKDVVADTVFFQMSNFATTKISGLRELRKDNDFNEQILSVTKSELKDMFDEGKIFDVERE